MSLIDDLGEAARILALQSSTEVVTLAKKLIAYAKRIEQVQNALQIIVRAESDDDSKASCMDSLIDELCEEIEIEEEEEPDDP